MYMLVSCIITLLQIYFTKFAGILAGVRPCGVIVLLSELYTLESKSQVYRYLHNYFSLHPETAQNIGMTLYWVHNCIMYVI